MNMPDEYDAALGERLSAALRTEADDTPVPPDAWARFRERDRAENSVASNTEPVEAQPVSTIQPRHRKHPWRVPLIAAAAVIAVAVTASAIATNGFRSSTDAGPAAGTPEGLDPATHVIVPIDSYPEIAAVIDSGGVPVSSIMDQTAISATPGPPPAVKMIFDAPPPSGTLGAQFDPPIGTTDGAIVGSGGGPDNSPLGYVSVAGGADTSAHLLWGAVGPDVAQVRVVVTTATPPGADPAATSGSATWFIDSGAGTGPAFLSAAAATVWTDMPYGYHAFALKLPVSSTVALLDAVDHNGDVIETARLDLTTGERTDLPVPPSSAADNPPFTTSAATSAPPIAATATGQDAPATPGYQAPTTPVPVPIDTDYWTFWTDGVVTGPPSGVNSGRAPAFGLASIQMRFVDGAPPVGILRGHYVRNTGALVTNAMDQKSDGTALGYVSREVGLASPMPGSNGFSATTVWGAVPPGVAGVTIVSDLAANSDSKDSSEGELRARWTFVVGAAGTGPAGSGNAGDNTQFTTIEGGYHGFAVQLPENATWAEVTASGPNGEVLQTRRFD